jgi:hypothetical protein
MGAHKAIKGAMEFAASKNQGVSAEFDLLEQKQ